MRYQIGSDALASDGTLVVTERQGVALVVLAERSMHERVADRVREGLLAVAQASGGRMALSLAGVSDLASAGVNALLAVRLKCQELGGQLVVFAPEPEVQRMFQVTRLDRVLRVEEDAASAAATFKTPTSWLAKLRQRVA